MGGTVDKMLAPGEPRSPAARMLYVTFRECLANVTSVPMDKHMVALDILRSKLALIPEDTIHLTLNLDHQKGWDAEPMIALANALRTNRALVKLSLKNVGLTYYPERPLQAICAMIGTNRSITTLDLGDNPLGPDGVKIIMEAVRRNGVIRRIYISKVGAGDEGAHIIARTLEDIRVLRSRQVSASSSMSVIMPVASGGGVIAGGAGGGGWCLSSLEWIDLSSNGISNKGCEALALALKNYHFLLNLYLEDNDIDEKHMLNIANLIQRNNNVHGVIDWLMLQVQLTKRKGSEPFIGRRRGRSIGSIPDPVCDPVCEMERSCRRFDVGMSETIGRRKTMEDKMVVVGRFGTDDGDLLGIFDGHGGKDVSDFVARNLPRLIHMHVSKPSATLHDALRRSFEQIHQDVSSWAMYTGTTATVVVITEQNIVAANAGDSRVILVRKKAHNSTESLHQRTSQPSVLSSSTSDTSPPGTSQRFTVNIPGNNNVEDMEIIRLTLDHRPDLEEERLRIVSLGGDILNGRVNSTLAVTRAIGDSILSPYIIARPFIKQIRRDLPRDQFLVLACDGVWDVLSDEQATSIVQRALAEGGGSHHAAQMLMDSAYTAGSQDNISVMIADLSRPPPDVKNKAD